MTLPIPSRDFVHSLELPGNPDVQGSGPDRACVAGSSLVSFTSGMSRQNREDVLNSTLLLQLAANKAFSKAGQRQEWFDFYINGLSRLGWVVSSGTLEEYTANQSAFTIDEVALDIIDLAQSGSSFTPIVRKSLASLEKNQSALSLFESRSHHVLGAMFQILPCTQTADGNVVMLLNCMEFSSNSLRTDILFSSYRRSEVKIFHSTQLATLDLRLYSHVRETVLNKLDHNASQFVKQLAL